LYEYLKGTSILLMNAVFPTPLCPRITTVATDLHREASLV